jgi:hypothetical protein
MPSLVGSAPTAAVCPDDRGRKASSNPPAARTSGQLTLFVVDPRPLAGAEGSAHPAWAQEPGRQAVPASRDGQIELFAHPVMLARELEVALGRGRFEEAAGLRRLLSEAYGPSRDTVDLGFLERLGGLVWQRQPGEALAIWTGIDGQLRERPHLRARLREGVFKRLLESHRAEALVTARPECLPSLVAVLGSCVATTPEGGRRCARDLVRDALLDGRGLESLDFKEDAALADLLAENLPPRWLVCLGLVRRLWSTPPPDEADIEALRSPPAETQSDEAAALGFWQCLRVSESADCPEDLLHEARRRMKRLRPELHGLYLRRAGGRVG